MEQINSVCIRCGKARVFSKKWKEKVDGRGPVVVHIESVCPDKECQKVVDTKFTEMREKRESSLEKRKSISLNRKSLTS